MPRGDSGDSCSVAALPDGGEDTGPAPAEMEMVVKLPARAILGLSVALQQFLCELSMLTAGQVVSLAVSSQPCSCLTALSIYSGWCHDCRGPILTSSKGLCLAVCHLAHRIRSLPEVPDNCVSCAAHKHKGGLQLTSSIYRGWADFLIGEPMQRQLFACAHGAGRSASAPPHAGAAGPCRKQSHAGECPRTGWVLCLQPMMAPQRGVSRQLAGEVETQTSP